MSNLSKEFAQYHQPVVTEKTPQEVTASGETSQPIKARLAYNAVGVCMYCQKIMRKTQCCGQMMFFCQDDRNVVPMPNEEVESIEAINFSMGSLA